MSAPTQPEQRPGRARILTVAAPGVFVLLWSTGFIGAKLGLPYAEPFTFLALRYALVSAALLAAALVVGARWPEAAGDVLHTVVAGLLLHGVYLGGVFASLHAGVEAGVSALIVGLQPVLTAAIAGPLLGERLTRTQVLGLVLGFAGVTLVVWQKLGHGAGTATGISLSLLALVGITLGTLYQKRFCGRINMLTGNFIQFAAAGVAMTVLAGLLEAREVVWAPAFVFALLWLSGVLSLGAISLLYLLIRRGAAARVASLFYLVPPCTALIAWWLFDERFGWVAVSGMALAVAGVALVNLGERASPRLRR